MRRNRWRVLPLLSAAALLAGCAGSATKAAAPRPTQSATPMPYITPTTAPLTGFPPFTDSRVVYIGQDAFLHAVSLDGKSDVRGPHAPVGAVCCGFWPAGVAAGGQRLAFSDEYDVFALDTSTSPAAQFRVFPFSNIENANSLYWSPDGARLAVNSRPNGISVITLATGAVAPVPIPTPTTSPTGFTPPPEVGTVYGWLDNAHLAVEYVPGEFPNQAQWAPVEIESNLDSLDIATGALRPIATIRPSPASQMQGGSYSLTPDDAVALFIGAQYRAAPYSPLAIRVDTVTGQVRELPAISAILPTVGGIFKPLWVPHTHRALVWYTPATGNGGVSCVMIDVDRDTVTPVTLSGFPVAWSPDGSTLIVASSIPSDAPDNGVSRDAAVPTNYGPVFLSAVTLKAGWAVTSTVTLTSAAMLIPTLGLLHTA